MRHPQLSISRQCQLLNLCRGSLYYHPETQTTESKYNLELMKLIDQKWLECPFYGSRRITEWLNRQKHPLNVNVNRKRICRLMNLMGIEAIYPKKKRLSTPGQESGNIKFPYLLRNLSVDRANYVWSADITYIPMKKGFLYLVAIIDWYSRYVLSWEVSLTLEKYFCITALEKALSSSSPNQPEIFNTDQGSQFTTPSFFKILLDQGIAISMDGRGRVFDNIFIERLWRSLKYEEVYLKEYNNVREAIEGLNRYFTFYNTERPHQALGYRSPLEVHFGLRKGGN
jgi:putative transposase